MKKYLIWGVLMALAIDAGAINNPSTSKTLKNGLKVIVCEKPGNDYVYLQVWYRTGSKDEVPGIRGMAHMFEHMMFRGTTKYPGDALEKNLEKAGGNFNASTHNDFTEYHEYIPKSALELGMDMEADRMANLKVTQEVLNTERQVVGEEFRNWMNDWNRRMALNEYKVLYPDGHPYTVNTIGNLDEITAFTAAQCMAFYNNYYSPNNAYVIVTGNVKSEDVFTLAEKYFGPLTKQLNLKARENLPDLVKSAPKKDEMPLDQMLQVYSYAIPFPAISTKDYFALNMLTDMVFLNENSILNNRLVKKGHQVFAIVSDEETRFYLYPSIQTFNFYMSASPGNLKVKKAVKDELAKIKTEGIPKSSIDNYITSEESREIQGNYSSEAISWELGEAELYFNDYHKAYAMIDEYRKVSPDDLKRVASTYFADDRLHVINIKPE
jgi:zinc protease